MKKTIHQNGFTLIELLVVIAIIGLLSSIVLASVGTARSKARDAQRMSDIRQLRTALQLYLNDNNGVYPVNLNLLQLNGYIRIVPKDPLLSTTCPPLANQQGYCYAYCPSTSPTTYHLGAQLESLGKVTGSDKDFDSSAANSCSPGVAYTGGFSGSDSPSPYFIYDITP